MREILFRGKRKDNGEWIEGNGIVQGQDGISYARWVDICDDKMRYEVIPESVLRFTGLKDKNGKKIFEGDIIKAITIDTNTEQLAVIGFGKFVDGYGDDEYIGFYIEFDGLKTTITQLLMEEVKGRFEVIGNIYDNPEFLGEEK